MKQIEKVITIDAPAKTVWQVLMNHKNYPQWNPFITSIQGTAEEGSTLDIEISPQGKKPMRLSPQVLTNKKNKEFRWKGKLFLPKLFDGEHYFILEAIEPQKTKFIHGEKFSGILVGLLWPMLADSTLAGFEDMNQALKQAAEKLFTL